MIYLRLFWEFFKVGLFSVGGGLATLPFLYSLGAKTGWFSTADVANMLAVSESTPGPIGVNMATYAGFDCGGVLGGVVATLGLVTPSVIVIVLIAMALQAFRTNKYVDAAFYVSASRPSSMEKPDPVCRDLGAHQSGEAAEKAAPGRVPRPRCRCGYRIPARRRVSRHNIINVILFA